MRTNKATAQAASNLRHAAALTLLGWYLMIPPLNQNHRLPPDTSAPLSSWTQWSAYGSAAQCRDAKVKLAEALSKGSMAAAKSQMKNIPEYPGSFDLYAAKILRGLCVESNDPRLAK